MRHDHLKFTIPYEFEGGIHTDTLDFIVRLADSTTLILEIEGEEDEQDQAKRQATKRWVAAVNR